MGTERIHRGGGDSGFGGWASGDVMQPGFRGFRLTLGGDAATVSRWLRGPERHGWGLAAEHERQTKPPPRALGRVSLSIVEPNRSGAARLMGRANEVGAGVGVARLLRGEFEEAGVLGEEAWGGEAKALDQALATIADLFGAKAEGLGDPRRGQAAPQEAKDGAFPG